MRRLVATACFRRYKLCSTAVQTRTVKFLVTHAGVRVRVLFEWSHQRIYQKVRVLSRYEDRDNDIRVAK
jgi:hypothetical protein